MKTRILILILVLVVAVLVWSRIMLPSWTKDYVNKVIASLDGYAGSVEEINIHLWRGAYSLHNIQINKKEGNIPVPFLDIPVMDLSIEWKALFHHRIVAVIKFEDPVINFAVSPDGKNSQTGKEANWADSLKKLAPFDINLITVKNGTVTYRDFSSDPKVDISIKDMFLEARNLRNVEDKAIPLPSPFNLKGKSIGNGDLAIEGNINILTEPVDFYLDGKLENINLPAFNNYTRAYAAIDFDKGTLNIYTELAVKHGKVSGYVKPLARDISFIDLSKQDKNPLNLVWQSIVATFATIFKNQPKDQLATKIPLEGNISDPKVAVWPTLAGIFKNGFIQALSNNIDNTVNFHNSPK